MNKIDWGNEIASMVTNYYMNCGAKGFDKANPDFEKIIDYVDKLLSDQKAEDYREVKKELKQIALKFSPDGEYPVGFWDEVWQFMDGVEKGG